MHLNNRDEIKCQTLIRHENRELKCSEARATKITNDKVERIQNILYIKRRGCCFGKYSSP
jgi:hypothetical protein